MSFGAYWAGVACSMDRLSPPRYTRARGVEASVSSVAFRSSVFGFELLPKFEAARFAPRAPDAAPAALVHLNATTPQDDPGGEPRYRGDLVFAQTFDGTTDQVRVETFRDLYYVEAQKLDTDTDDPLIVVTLADVRHFWDDHGEITAQWNVERPGGLAAKGSKGRGADGATPLREIMQAILNALPGKLQISVWPEASDLPARVVNVRCWGASPKEVLKKLLEVYRLEFDIGPDARARFYVSGTGTVGELSPGGAGDNDLEHDLTSPLGSSPWSSSFTADGYGYVARPAHENPVEVVVVGDRTIYDVRVDWLTPVLPYETSDPVTGSPVEHVIEATPQNLTDFVQRKLPGQRSYPGPGVGAPIELLAGRGGQERIDLLRGDVEEPKRGPLDFSPAVRVILGDPTPALPQVEAALAGGARDLTGVGPISRAVDSLKNPIPLPGGASSFNDPAQPEGTLLLPHLWQQLPGLDAKDWPLALREINEADRRALKRLWRVVQVPKTLRRLLPLRKRAEVDHKGKRLEIVVEAFGFRAIKVQIVDEEEIARRELIIDEEKSTAEKIAILEDETHRFEREKKAALRQSYEDLCNDIERLRKTLDVIRAPTLAELSLLLTEETQDIIGLDEAALEDPALQREREANNLTSERTRRLLGDFLNAAGPLGDFLALGDDAFGLDGITTKEKRENLGVDLAAKEERLRKQVAKLEDQKLELEKKLNPLGAAWHEQGLLLLEAEQQRQETGQASESVAAKIDAKQREIDRLTKKQSEEIATGADVPHEFQVPMKEEQRFVNLGRRRVEFRVLDRERGLIELADLPCWVKDEHVSSLDQTILIPMPVRVTFGTTNSVDVDLVSLHEEDVPGFYMNQVATALRANPELFKLLGTFGHKLPIEVGDGQARYTFTKGDAKPRSGDAAVGPWPYRVLLEERGNPFRLLVRLSGESNDEVLRARARAIADALLDRPDTVDSGRLIMFEPRRVALNGRMSAQEIRLDKHGAGWVTEVSFNSDVAPIDDVVEGVERSRGPIRLVFGIDVEEDRE